MIADVQTIHPTQVGGKAQVPSSKSLCHRAILAAALAEGESQIHSVSFSEDIEALGNHFKDYRMIERVEILPYHTLGVHKYEAMVMTYRLTNVPVNTPQQLDEIKQLFSKYFKTVYVN